jgi:hypothetical protein
MMTIHCETCQREIYGDVRTLHGKCFLDLMSEIDRLNTRIKELEEEQGKRSSIPNDEGSPCASPGTELSIVPERSSSALLTEGT